MFREKNFGQKVLGQKQFWVEKKLGSENILDPKSCFLILVLGLLLIFQCHNCYTPLRLKHICLMYSKCARTLIIT